MEKIIKIDGMMCSRCEERVKKALEALPQVEEAIPDHEKNIATVILSEDIPFETLKTCVEDQGFDVIG